MKKLKCIWHLLISYNYVVITDKILTTHIEEFAWDDFEDQVKILSNSFKEAQR